MENFRLKVFRVVAESLNFTQAADILYLTQPAVTLQIKALEEALGARLFDRSGNKIALTPAGETLLRYAIEIDELIARAENHIGQLKGEERGKLLVGASTTIAQYLLPRLVGDFVAANSYVEPSILGANTKQIVDALAGGAIALGLIEGPARRSDLKTERFIEDEIVMIVPASHEWTVPGAAPIEAVGLSGAPLIMRERGSGTRQVVEQALKKGGLKMRDMRIVMELDSTEAIKSAVEAGLGIGFVSEWGLIKERQLDTIRMIKIAGMPIRRQFLFIYPRGPEPDGIAGAFLRFARKHRQRVIDCLPSAKP